MKKILRIFLYTLFSFYLTSLLIKGFVFTAGFKSLVYSAVVFTLINIFIKPLIKLLTLPLNFLSLGLFSWLVNIFLLYLLTIIFPEIKITPWVFNRFSAFGFVIPQIKFTIFYTLVLVSFLFSFSINFLNWLCLK